MVESLIESVCFPLHLVLASSSGVEYSQPEVIGISQLATLCRCVLFSLQIKPAFGISRTMPRKPVNRRASPTDSDDDVFDSEQRYREEQTKKKNNTKAKEKKRRSRALNTTVATWDGEDEDDEEVEPDPSPPPPPAAKSNRQTPGQGVPRTSSVATNGTDAETMASLGMTNEEIVTHYANCIRLAAESKINSKNAFHLQLIDVMGLMMKTQEKQGQGANRFQYASCALDASAKIYAVRVDTVYGDTMNTVTTMTKLRAGGNVGDDDVPQLDDDGNPLPPTQAKPKRRRKKMGNTIEKNKENLLVTEKELVSDVVSHGRIQIDEGRLGVGVFLQLAKPVDDSQFLQLNERSKFVYSRMRTDDERNREKAVYGALKEKNWTMDFDAIFEAGGEIKGDEDVLHDKELDEFDWNWNAEDEKNGGKDEGDETLMHSDDFRFNADKPVEEPVPDNTLDDMDLMEPFEDDFAGGADGDPAATLVENVAAFEGTYGRDRFADDPLIADNPTSMAAEPNDYSYFDRMLLHTWSGKDKWIRYARRRGNPRLALIAAGIEEKKVRKQRKKKDEYLIPDWDPNTGPRGNVADVADHFTQGKAVSTVPDKIITTWPKYNLPDDHKVGAQRHYSYFTKNLDFTTEQRREYLGQFYPMDVVRDTEDEYDYDNPNDRSYCARVEGDGEDFLGGGGGDDDDDDDMPPPDTNPFMEALSFAGAAECALIGDNLITAPKTVEVVDIGYAKTAKRIDMRRLKGTLWMILAKKEDDRLQSEFEQRKRRDPNLGRDDEPEYGRSMGDFQVKFSEAYHQLVPRLPKQMAEDLTPHLAFAAVLHLINEKELFGVGQKDHGDFIIRKWVPTDGIKKAPVFHGFKK